MNVLNWNDCFSWIGDCFLNIAHIDYVISLENTKDVFLKNNGFARF